MDFGSLTRAQYLAMFKRMLGVGGYDTEEGALVDELDASAYVAAKVSETLEAAASNMFVRHADELVQALERVMAMPSDAPRTLAERRARLLLFQQTVSSFAFTRVKTALDSFIGAAGTSVVPNVTGRTEYESTQTWKYLNASANLQERLAADVVLKRIAPAHFTEPPKAAATQVTWNTDVDPDGSLIDIDPDAPFAAADVQYPSRIYSFGAGSVLTPKMIREIQANLFWSYYGGVPTSHHFSNVLVRGAITASTTVTIDGPSHGTEDWSDRVVEVYGVVSDADLNDSAGAMELVVAPTGVGWTVCKPTVADSSLRDVDTGATMDIAIGVDGSGNLELINNNVADTLYVALFVRATGPSDGSSTTNTAPWIHAAKIDKSGSAPTAFDSMESAAAVRPQANVTTAGGWTPASVTSLRTLAVRRIAGKTCVKRPASGAQSIVLDSSVDWRNRYVLASMWRNDGTQDVYPGASGFLTRTTLSSPGLDDTVPRLFFTRTGAPSGQGTRQTYQMGSSPSATEATSCCWIYAHETTGDLMMDVKANATSAYVSCVWQVIATDNLASSPAQPTIPTSGTYVQPVDLNVIQDNGISIQGQTGAGRGYPSRRRTSLATALNTQVTATPLGPIPDAFKRPFRPASWFVTERQGALPDVLIEHRQHIWGNRKIMASVSIADGEVATLHLANDPALEESYDLIDMRDRLVRLCGAYSASDIRYHTANDGSSKFYGSVYVGPHAGVIEANLVSGGSLFMRAKMTHDEYDGDGQSGYQSVLQIGNETGATVYLYAIIEVSPQLGFAERRTRGFQ